MSGPLFNVTRSLFIPKMGQQDLKTLSTPSIDASSLDEKQGMYENEKAQGVTANFHQARQTFSQADINRVLNAFAALAKGCATFLHVQNNVIALLKAFVSLHCKKEPILLKEAVIQPNLALVRSRPATIDAPTPKPLPSHINREELKTDLSKKKALLTESQASLNGLSALFYKSVKDLLGDYEKEIKTLENVIKQGKQDTSAPLSSCFTEEQGYIIIHCVDELSRISADLTQASKPLCKVPKLVDSKFVHGVVVNATALTGAATLAATGVAFPIVGCIGLSISILGMAGFWAYGKYKNKDAQQWKERINPLTNTTKLEKLKGDVMTSVLQTQRTDINRNTASIDQLGTKQQSVEKELREALGVERERRIHLEGENQQLRVNQERQNKLIGEMLTRLTALEANNSANSHPELSKNNALA